MADRENPDEIRKDFLATPLGTLVAWGLPIGAMLLMIGTPHPLKTWVWVGALVWMGGACLLNARRCKRRHCFVTGPFFLAMTVPVLLFGYGLIDLGDGGWRWLGIAVGVGAFGLTALTERGGKYG